MTLLANQATDLLGMTISSPGQAFLPQTGPFGIVFLAQIESTTSVHSEGTIALTSLNGTRDLTQLYNFGLGPDPNLGFEYTTFGGLVIGDVEIVPGPACDFNFDTACNLIDINLMYAVNGYNLVTGVATTGATEKFDLVDDNQQLLRSFAGRQLQKHITAV